MPRTNAGPDVAGKMCPFCQTQIGPNAPVHVCDACNMPHHAECWDHNQGCTTFGCSCCPGARPRADHPAAARSTIVEGECQVCGYLLGPFESACPRCENMRRQGIDPMRARGPVAAPPMEQSYGQPFQIDQGVQSTLSQWNWGAFAITPIWCAAMNQWGYFALSLFLNLCCGIGGLVMSIVFGIKGNEMAWTTREWRDIQEFRETQAVWNSWGIGLFILRVILICIWVAIAISDASNH